MRYSNSLLRSFFGETTSGRADYRESKSVLSSSSRRCGVDRLPPVYREQMTPYSTVPGNALSILRSRENCASTTSRQTTKASLYSYRVQYVRIPKGRRKGMWVRMMILALAYVSDELYSTWLLKKGVRYVRDVRTKTILIFVIGRSSFSTVVLR